MSPLEKIKAKLQANEPVIGTHVVQCDPSVTELIANLDYDFIWLDMEHTAIDKKDVLYHLIAAKGTGTAVFVRVPWNDPVLVKPIIDMGPDGIIFPYIRSVEEAKLAIASCLYPPKGIRGFGPLRASDYGGYGAMNYIRDHEHTLFKMIQIEHIDAFHCMEEIAEIDGLDALIVGPADFSGSIGRLAQTREPDVMAVYDQIGEKIRKLNIPVGVSIGPNLDNMRDWVGRGVKFVAMHSDVEYISMGAKQNYREMQQVFQQIRGN